LSRAAREKAVHPIPASEAISAWKETLAATGVLCLTEVPDDLLMWGHYAHSHQGVCLGFKTNSQPLMLAQRVHYGEERPIWRRFARDFKTAIVEALSTKALAWEYEREWRIFVRDRLGYRTT
jgi:hypothetical protein